MENTCVKVLSKEHGKKVIEYYKSLGVEDVDLFNGSYIGKYYGIFGGKFSAEFGPFTSKVIELPEIINNKFDVGEYVYLYDYIYKPYIVRFSDKECCYVEEVLNEEPNIKVIPKVCLKSYYDYQLEPKLQVKTIDKLILAYYIDVRNINHFDIQKYIEDVTKNFTEKGDESVIQYFIPIKNETKIECVYSPTNTEIKDLNKKLDEFIEHIRKTNNYIKNN